MDETPGPHPLTRRRPESSTSAHATSQASWFRFPRFSKSTDTTVPLLIIDDLGMRKLPATAGEDLLETVMRRYERASTLITSSRPVEDWGKLLGDTAAVTALLDRLLHHAHVLTCGPRSWRTRLHGDRAAGA